MSRVHETGPKLMVGASQLTLPISKKAQQGGVLFEAATTFLRKTHGSIQAIKMQREKERLDRPRRTSRSPSGLSPDVIFSFVGFCIAHPGTRFL
jgi:hypothetical protein